MKRTRAVISARFTCRDGDAIVIVITVTNNGASTSLAFAFHWCSDGRGIASLVDLNSRLCGRSAWSRNACE